MCSEHNDAGNENLKYYRVVIVVEHNVCVCVCTAEEKAGLRGEGGEDAAGSGSAPGSL